ncbi:biotin biosynthesis protein BioY [Thermococcus kodakarensis KOD1]|uniref:Biotin biosynthesis protein BioY n=1 Tax=Thermococcus kodakarensis (strain ATCC BAA-918 / JCM 12380 / KOD1) TaxID=69014 RepID=Q5JHD2_THEKO|nr:biotin transporter BioY [Thermococcus kodakarensis]WCN29218.1 biotin transporter BioY [Thermococcus kodakarensis]WCN31520.1 biotin transporter BioY [Thermococcus kodakarensis]BAD84937.1 biotin biosynthesis protein BioY [Thermococcus kodakarensis KOD1]
MNAREVAYAGIFIALIAVSAQISVNIGPVPLTFQVFAVLLTGLLLGPRLGFLSVLSYDIAGAIGLPVFAGFTGGIAHLYGPTGGYLLAFPIAAFMAGLSKGKGGKAKLVASLVAIALIYVLGWLRLGLYFGGNFGKAFELGVAPFVIPDLIKALIAVEISEVVERRLEL